MEIHADRAGGSRAEAPGPRAPRIALACPRRPVLFNGAVYFAVGIFPLEGAWVCAANADNGKPLWINGKCALSRGATQDHGGRWDTGLSPQGYLSIAGEKVCAPGWSCAAICGKAALGAATAHWRTHIQRSCAMPISAGSTLPRAAARDSMTLVQDAPTGSLPLAAS